MEVDLAKIRPEKREWRKKLVWLGKKGEVEEEVEKKEK